MRGGALGLVLLAALACAPHDPQTPREAFDALRQAIRAPDGRKIEALLDGDTLWHRRGRIREWRALVARGETPEALTELHLTPAEVCAGSEDDAVALVLQRNFPLTREADWFAAAEVALEEPDGPDQTRLVLRGKDGDERELWFVREAGGWRFDNFRTHRQW